MRNSRLFITLGFLLSLFSLPASSAVINIDYNVSLAGNYHGLFHDVDAGDTLHFTNTSGSYYVRIESYLTSFTETIYGPDEFDSGVFGPGGTFDYQIVGPSDFHLAVAFWQTPAARSTGYAIQDINVTPAAASVPVPAAAWLFGAGLLGLTGTARRRKTQP